MDNKYLPDFKGLMAYTQVPNSFLDNMQDFTIYEIGVYIFLCRKIIGWKDKRIDLRDKISLSQIQNGLNIARSSVQKALNGLIEKGLIAKENTKGTKNCKGINEYRLLSQEVYRDKTYPVPQSGNESPKPIPPDSHTKETTSNKLNKESDIYNNNKKSVENKQEPQNIPLNDPPLTLTIFKDRYNKLSDNKKYLVAKYAAYKKSGKTKYGDNTNDGMFLLSSMDYYTADKKTQRQILKFLFDVEWQKLGALK